MKRTQLFILLFVFTSGISQNKRNKIDSLLRHAVSIGEETPELAIREALKGITLSAGLGYKKGIVVGSLFISESYRRSKDDGEALFYAVKADKNCRASDSYYKSKALRLKGISLARLGFYKEAENLLNKALYFANKIKDKNNKYRSLGFIYANIAINHDDNGGSKDLVADYLQKSDASFSSMDVTDVHKKRCMAFAYLNWAAFHIRGNRLDKARFYLDESIAASQRLHLNYLTIEQDYSQGTLSYCKGNFEAAKKQFLKALLLSNANGRIFYKKDLYYSLFKTYEAQRLPDSSRYYRAQYIVLNDSLNGLYKKAINTSLNLFVEEECSESLLKLEKQLLIIGISFLLMVLVYRYTKVYRRKWHKAQKEKEAINRYLQRQSELLRQLKKGSSYSRDRTQKLLQLVATGNPAFLSEFKETYPDFCPRIIEISPGIIGNELKFCAMLKLNLTTSEIAEYTKSTLRAVESKKYRIRKKLNIPQDKELYEWISRL
ncbi:MULTISPECIES: hypothetical protein [unclassified Flavobacterium]|uniref:helix-turn-helix transcriptional regulator n=1 Tax=unclassified Flavobacterium TaxID=196869 RepID=UPI00086A02E7|nr:MULTISPECIES: hypothetical protein [unclassified Flavobacterium]MBN9283625.1 hypothetical protein [Flavobacterium sp.]ODS86146.1 MAG: hypothetical protein ABS44_13850 [Chryseobacterium sp. SCN 40-13]OJV69266.1 MAG: hypothetical protein BGO42_12860 [Flavobacterium sp. 40-81]